MAGNSVDQKIATLGAEYTPTAPWGLGIKGAYGRLDSVIDPKVSPLGNRSFVEGGASAFYRISVGTIEIAGTHHETLGAGGAAGSPIIKVNRFSLRLGGTF